MSAFNIQYRIKKTPDGYEGLIALPTSLSAVMRNAVQRMPAEQAKPFKKQLATMVAKPLATKAAAEDPASAIENAAALAKRIAENPLVADLLPPGTQSAIAAAEKVAQAVKDGTAAELLKKAGSPLTKLASGISSLF